MTSTSSPKGVTTAKAPHLPKPTYLDLSGDDTTLPRGVVRHEAPRHPRVAQLAREVLASGDFRETTWNGVVRTAAALCDADLALLNLAVLVAEAQAERAAIAGRVA